MIHWNRKLIGVALGLALVGGAALVWRGRGDSFFGQPESSSGVGATSAADREQPLVLGPDYRRYANPTYHFSLEYPQELAVRTSASPDGETIVFESEGQRETFQIFVAPFHGEGPLTRERIRQDLPKLIVLDPLEVIIGSGIRALRFTSQDPAVGRTREVWFTEGGFLYAVTTYEELDDWIGRILTTWRFE